VNDPRLLQYLKQDLGLSEAALALVSRQQQPTVTELPIVAHGTDSDENGPFGLKAIFWLTFKA